MISILVAVVAVSVTLGGLILTGNCGLRQDVAQVEARLSEDVKQSESRLREDMGHLRGDLKQLGDRVERLDHGQAKLEGLLEGLREAISGRAVSG